MLLILYSEELKSRVATFQRTLGWTTPTTHKHQGLVDNIAKRKKNQCYFDHDFY